MKRFTCLLLALTLVAAMAIPASAANTGDDTDIDYKSLIISGNFCAAIDKNHDLWTWGSNNGLQLGNGTKPMINYCEPNPVKVLSNVASFDGTHALTLDGGLYTAGDNRYGECGNGTTSVCTRYTKIMDNVGSLSGVPTMAIKKDGSLWAWGRNDYGKVGNGLVNDKYVEDYGKEIGIITRPVKILDNVKSVATGTGVNSLSAAVKNNGELYIWGGESELFGPLISNAQQVGDEYILTKPTLFCENVKEFSIYTNRFAVIMNDNSLWMMGQQGGGILGNGVCDWGYSTFLTKVMDDVASVYLSADTTAAIKLDGSLWMWGKNSYGQLGTNGKGNATYQIENSIVQTVPVKVMDDVEAVSVDSINTIALKKDGTLWAWGANYNVSFHKTVPFKVMDGVVKTSGLYGDVYVKKDGTHWKYAKYAIGEVPKQLDRTGHENAVFYDTNMLIEADGSLYRWGADDYLQVGVHDSSEPHSYNYMRPDVTTPVKLPSIKMAAPTYTQPSVDKSTAKGLTNFVKRNTFSSNDFTDIAQSLWYYDSVKTVIELGIMGGKGNNVFDPNGNITVAEALKMACVVHNVYGGGSGEFAQGNPWYQVYVDYAIKNGIIKVNNFDDYTRNATRSEMAYIFAHSVPTDVLPEINIVNSLPDVSAATKYNTEIFYLYRAGVLTGNDQKGTFTPADCISRAQAAAIISRIALPEIRKSLVLNDEIFWE